jgi:hypothetical protein
MKTQLYMLASFMFLLGSSAFAQDQPEKTQRQSSKQPTPEMRQKMAAAHDKMATCLRSDRPVKECREEMMESCHKMMGKDGCPMMDGMMHSHRGKAKRHNNS